MLNLYMKNYQKFVLGADIGGSHITVSVINTEDKNLLRQSYVRESLDSTSSMAEIMESWAHAIKKSIALSGHKISQIGLALPGPFDYEKGISYIKNQGKYENLYQVNIKEKLSEALVLPVDNLWLDNDASCFLKGEIFVENLNINENILGLTLGTGLGSVVAINGQVKDAALWCSTFKDKQAEDFISTRWFLKRYQEISGDFIGSVKLICQEGNYIYIAQLFKEFGENLHDFLTIQIDTFQPRVIVIGGNIAKASKYFMPYLSTLKVPVKITTIGEDAALIGAASNFFNSNR